MGTLVQQRVNLAHRTLPACRLPIARRARRTFQCSASAAHAPLIQEGWPLWALLAASGAAAQVAEKRTRVGATLSAPLVAMGAGMGLTAAGILPADCESYTVIWKYIMPCGAACFLLETDLSHLLEKGGPVLCAFLVGAFTMVIGALVGWHCCGQLMGPDGSKLAACLCASYVGGSANFAAVANACNLPTAAMPAAMAADNLGMSIFLGALMSLPQRLLAGRWFSGSQSSQPEAAQHTLSMSDSNQASDSAVGDQGLQQVAPTAENVALVLAAAGLSCASGSHVAYAAGMASLNLLFMAVFAALLSSIGTRLFPSTQTEAPLRGKATQQTFAGAAQLGGALFTIFFTMIGCSAGSLSVLARPEVLGMLVFLCVMVGVHWACMLAINQVLRLPGPALVLGSNACVGGPATAAGMAMSRGWHALAQPAMLSGSLGYAVGTAAGLAVAKLAGIPLKL